MPHRRKSHQPELHPRAVRRDPTLDRRPLAGAAVLALGTSLLGSAPVHAAPDDPPSKAEVRAAEERAGDAAVRVEQIRAALAAANLALEDAAVRAEQASEAYNAARWRLEQATEAYEDARTQAARARRDVAAQRERIAGLVVGSYEQGGDLTALQAVFGGEGPEGVMEQYLAYEGASSSLHADYDRFSASSAIAKVFEEKAERARAERAASTRAARQARQAAISAATAAQAAAAGLAAEKETLVRELAQAQGVSVRLARQRQEALEERARLRAQQEAEAEAAEAVGQDEAADSTTDAAEGPGSRPADGGGAATDSEAVAPLEPAPMPAAAPTPAPAAPAPAPSSDSGGAARAIAFARAQLGDPYQWAAAGPDSWDCSGLTMGAWGAAGVSLPHYSVAQYDATTRISASDLRPGDLVFWGTTSSPSSIHHVAMYIGDGQIIHAPRTGRPVSIDSMYYWVPPNFFGRV